MIMLTRVEQTGVIRVYLLTSSSKQIEAAERLWPGVEFTAQPEEFSGGNLKLQQLRLPDLVTA
jgi:hypothetical protein